MELMDTVPQKHTVRLMHELVCMVGACRRSSSEANRLRRLVQMPFPSGLKHCRLEIALGNFGIERSAFRLWYIRCREVRTSPSHFIARIRVRFHSKTVGVVHGWTGLHFRLRLRIFQTVSGSCLLLR